MHSRKIQKGWGSDETIWVQTNVCFKTGEWVFGEGKQCQGVPDSDIKSRKGLDWQYHEGNH